MTASKHDTKPGWVDPDDAPELTEEMLDAARISIGGKVIRPARGRLGPGGVTWDEAPPRKKAGGK